jgi:hypothetical protein
MLADRMKTYFVCAILLVACSHRTPDQQLMKDVGPAISWIATLHFAAQQWLDDAVPDVYVRLTIEDAQKAFENAIRSVDQSEASNALRDQIRRKIETSREAAQYLQQAIEKGDRKRVGEIAQRLSRLRRGQ